MSPMLLASSLAMEGFRVILGPRLPDGTRPFTARRAGVIVHSGPGQTPHATVVTPLRFTTSF